MRIQLVVTDAQHAMIEALREQIGATTIKEVFNNALTLLNWAVRQRAEGSAICAINEEKNVHKELQLPALESLASGDPVVLDHGARQKPREEHPQAGQSTTLDDLGITKAAREEKLRERDQKIKRREEAERIEALYREHILKEPKESDIATPPSMPPTAQKGGTIEKKKVLRDGRKSS